MWDLSSPTRDWTRGPLHWKLLDHQESLKTSNSLQISDSWLLTRCQNCYFVSSLEQEVKTGKNWRLLFMDELGIRNLLHDTPPKTPNPGSSSSSCVDWQACFRHVTAPIRLFLALLSDCWMKQIPVLLSGFSLTHTKPPNDLAVASTSPFPPQVLLMSVFKTLLSLLNPGSPPQILTCRLLHTQPRFLSRTRHSVLLKCPLNSLGPKCISSGVHGPRARYLFTTLDRLQGPRAFSLLFSVLAKPRTFACPERLPESRFRELNRSSVLRWGRRWHATPVLLPGKSHGRRSLVGCNPWGLKSQTQLSNFTFTFQFHALEKEMATHSSVLVWRIPGMAEPGGLPSMGLHRVRHD